MALVISTKKDAGYDVEVAGVGVCAARGKGGLIVDDAARVLHELQKDGEALSGKELESAARDFAKSRGLTIRTVKGDAEDEELRERLRVEAGAFPRGKTVEEVSREAAERDRVAVEAHDDESAPLEPSDLPPQAETGTENETAR